MKNLCKLCYAKHKHESKHRILPIIKHDMDSSSNLNYRRKIGPEAAENLLHSH